MRKIFICFAVCFVFSLSFTFTGCATVTGLQGKDAEYISENSRNIGRIEGTVEALGDTIADSRQRLEIVGRASERIRDAAERLDYLISEYELEVERILNEIDRLRSELEERKKGEMDGDKLRSNTYGSGGSGDNLEN